MLLQVLPHIKHSAYDYPAEKKFLTSVKSFFPHCATWQHWLLTRLTEHLYVLPVTVTFHKRCWEAECQLASVLVFPLTTQGTDFLLPQLTCCRGKLHWNRNQWVPASLSLHPFMPALEIRVLQDKWSTQVDPPHHVNWLTLWLHDHHIQCYMESRNNFSSILLLERRKCNAVTPLLVTSSLSFLPLP